MTRVIFACCFLLLSSVVHAQVPANPSAVEFTSLDHNAVIPAGQTNAGQQKLAGYQGMIFPAAADVSTGVPIAVGSVVAKTAAAPQATADTYRLTVTQLGLTGPNAIPVCAALPCPQYTLLLVAIGPNGPSAKGVASESLPFTAAVPVVGPPPAAPTNVKPLP